MTPEFLIGLAVGIGATAFLFGLGIIGFILGAGKALLNRF